MNTKLYWFIRNLWTRITFFIKKRRFSASYRRHNNKKTRTFSLTIIKTLIIQSIKAILICVIALMLDGTIMCMTKKTTLDNEIFLDIVIGGIGVAGVILGLYCSNMASTFSAKYTNAPESISALYQNDIITNKCMKQIINYITFCICLLAVCITDVDFYFVTVIVLLFLSIRTIITFSIAGNRAYVLSNTYAISNTIYPDILHITDKLIKKDRMNMDKSIQNHYRKICDNHIKILNDIANYNKSSSESQTTPIITFLRNNLTVLFSYIKKKPYIPHDSLWFFEKTQYQQWHNADDSDISIKIKFGLMLDTKSIKDYTWYETKFEQTNQICLDKLLKANDYSSLYSYLEILAQIPDEIIDHNSIIYWSQYIKSLKPMMLPIISKKQNNQQTNSQEAGIADAYAAVCYRFVRLIIQYIDKLDVNYMLDYATSINKYSKIDFQKNHYLNDSVIEDFYHRIETEFQIEKQQVTPTWYIEQIIAKKIYDHINLIAIQLSDMLEFVSAIGEQLLNDECYYNAAVWFYRVSEMDARISHHQTCEKLLSLEKLLLSKKKDQKILWYDSTIVKSIKTIKNISHLIPQSLKKCSGIFALTHQENRSEFPDLFGYSYNRFCECLVDAIANNELSTFKSLYNGFLGTVLAYQEYVRTDVIRHKEEHMQNVVFHIFSAPIMEFAIISGLAILWGEFTGEKEWLSTIKNEINPYTDKSNDSLYKILPWINKNIAIRKTSNMGICNRDIIETEWIQKVSYAIRNHPKYKISYGKYGQEYIESESDLFTAFTRCSFVHLGVLNNVEEVFCVVCINPHVQESEKYHTRSTWEEVFNNAEEQ